MPLFTSIYAPCENGCLRMRLTVKLVPSSNAPASPPRNTLYLKFPIQHLPINLPASEKQSLLPQQLSKLAQRRFQQPFIDEHLGKAYKNMSFKPGGNACFCLLGNVNRLFAYFLEMTKMLFLRFWLFIWNVWPFLLFLLLRSTQTVITH